MSLGGPVLLAARRGSDGRSAGLGVRRPQRCLYSRGDAVESAGILLSARPPDLVGLRVASVRVRFAPADADDAVVLVLSFVSARRDSVKSAIDSFRAVVICLSAVWSALALE